MAEYYTFENLECWRQAKDLALDLHRLSAKGSLNGDEVMSNQLRQSALRVMSRIAEGKARGSGSEFIYYLKLAKASAAGLQSSLILSRDMGYLGEGDFLDFQDRANRVSALVGGLINAIKKGQRERKEAKAETKKASSRAPDSVEVAAEIHEASVSDAPQEPTESVPF